jgi:hypothetical protein
VLRCRQAKRLEGFWPVKHIVSEGACEKSGQHRMIGLPDQDQLVALLLNDHGAALFRSGT